MNRRTAASTEIVELTEDESAELFNRVVEQKMGMSGDEFLARWDASEWTNVDPDEIPGLLDVWMYLPAVR